MVDIAASVLITISNFLKEPFVASAENKTFTYKWLCVNNNWI